MAWTNTAAVSVRQAGGADARQPVDLEARAAIALHAVGAGDRHDDLRGVVGSQPRHVGRQRLRPSGPWSDCRSDRSWRRRRGPPPGTCRAPRCSRRRRNGCWPWWIPQVRRVRPPSTTSSCPVMKSASSDASRSAPRAISIGWPEPAQGRLLLPDRADLGIVEVGARHAGIDGAGTDIVGGDVELAELERQRAREPADAGLGGAIGGKPVVGVESHHRGGVDDARPALLLGPRLQRRDGLAAQAEHCPHVDAVDMVPVLVGHLLDEGAAADAGIVEQDVDGAELGQRRGHDLLGRIVAGDVAAEGGDGVVAGMRLLDRRFRPVDRQHLRALVGEQLGRRGADARRRSGHDRDLSGQSGQGCLRFFTASLPLLHRASPPPSYGGGGPKGRRGKAPIKAAANFRSLSFIDHLCGSPSLPSPVRR